MKAKRKAHSGSKLPSREVEICARLREARTLRGHSQAEFADALKIKRERLASYESARAPLRFLLGLKVCRLFDINPIWLATGEGLYFPTVGCYYGVEDELDFRDTDLFSHVFDSQLHRIAFAHMDKLAQSGQLAEYLGDTRRFRYWLEYHLHYIFTRVPKAQWGQVSQHIGEAIIGAVIRLEKEGIIKPEKRG